MKYMIIQVVSILFCIFLFPTQAFAQEVQPIENESQDQMIEEEIPTENRVEELEEQLDVVLPEVELELDVPEIVEPEIVAPEVVEDIQLEVMEELIVQPSESVIVPDEIVDQPSEPGVHPMEPTPVPMPVDVVNVSASIYIPIVYPEYSDLGYVGEIEDAILYDHFTTKNYTRFEYAENPFMIGQCTWFAWSRFYQIYGFDSGARGNGKTNALEIVRAHEDLFELSSTPAAGAVFSMEENTLYPEYGHTGFVEAYDGEYVWISEGNVKFGQDEGNIWIHKVKWDEFKAQFPDVVFAVPKVNEEVKECFMDVHKTFLF